MRRTRKRPATRDSLVKLSWLGHLVGTISGIWELLRITIPIVLRIALLLAAILGGLLGILRDRAVEPVHEIPPPRIQLVRLPEPVDEPREVTL